jgi:shikimate kinase
MSESRRIYIIGFMGSGKTTAGKKLASSLKWNFLDLDIEIEHKTGKSINDIFSDYGEEHFRKLEAELLTSIITEKDTIISTGGGTPCYGNNMEFMLKTGLVIYIRMTPGQLKSRLESSSISRPLINNLKDSELLQFISDRLSEREKYYLRASVIVNGIDLDISALHNKIKTIIL